MTRKTLERTRLGGFTLIELLIVIVIIILLGTIAMAAMGPVLELVDRARCGAQLSSIFTAYMTYVNQYSKIFPPMYTPTEYNFESKNYNLDPSNNYYIINPSGKWQGGFGPLTWHNLIEAEYYICPSVADAGGPWWRTEANDDIDAWWGQSPNPHPDRVFREDRNLSTPANRRSFASYSIRHMLYPWTPSQVSSPQTLLGSHASFRHGRRAILADNLNSLRMIEERHKVGVNVSYIDGSVEFRQGGELMGIYEANPDNPNLDAVWATLDYRK